jgi:hypothetical protein
MSVYDNPISSSLERLRKRTASDNHRAQPQDRFHIILEDLDFAWTRQEMDVFIARWNNGQPLQKIAASLRPLLCPEDALDETLLLAIHLHRKGRIKTRP